MTIQVGDHVYWKIRVGMFYRTISGIVESIKGNTANVRKTTQKDWGYVEKDINGLTKSKN